MTHPHPGSGEGHDHGHGPETGHSHAPPQGTVYNWRIHHPYGPDGDEVAVEVAPLSGLLPKWRFVLPGDYEGVTRWGTGPSNGGEVSTDVRGPVQGGPVQLVNGPVVIWFGGLDPLSSRKSAYMVFKGDPPHYVAFGQAEEPEGPPGALEGVSFGDHPMHPGSNDPHAGHSH